MALGLRSDPTGERLAGLVGESLRCPLFAVDGLRTYAYEGKAKCYGALYAYCETVPLVDCHDHSVKLGPRYSDPFQVIIGEYLLSDPGSAATEADARTLLNQEIPWVERWPILVKAWQRTCHTGYAQITRRVLKKFYDEDEVTLAALHRMEEKLLDDEAKEVAYSWLFGNANEFYRLGL